MRSNRGRALVGIALALSLVVAACGRSDDTGSGESGGSENANANAGNPAAGVPGFDGTTIQLGVLTPQTGLAATIGDPLTAGNQLYFDRVNAAGGIAGKYKVELVVKDTEYRPEKAVQEYAATKDSVAMYTQILGTAIQEAVLVEQESDEILSGPATLDAQWVRNPLLMPIGAPYQIQSINGLDYAIRELDAANSTVCAMTKDDLYGAAGLEGLEYAAEQAGITIAEKQTFRQGDQDYTAQIGALSGAGCEIVWLTSLPTETIPLMTNASTAGFAPTWLANSPAWTGLLATGDLAPYLAENFLLMSEGPQWGDTSVPGMAQMLEDIQSYAPDQAANVYFAFGYAQAWAAAQILEKAVELGDLSQAGILSAMSQVDQLTFGDLLGDYTYGPAEDRDPPRASSVFAVDPTSNATGFLVALETNQTSQAAEEYTIP